MASFCQIPVRPRRLGFVPPRSSGDLCLALSDLPKRAHSCWLRTANLGGPSSVWVRSANACRAYFTRHAPRRPARNGYARRYALFTLVEIAGEDDLDAPDLLPPEQQASKPNEPSNGGNSRLNGGGHINAPQHPAVRRNGKLQSIPTEPTLGPEASAALRDRLVAELSDLACGDDAAIWAHRSLVEKNKLTAADAQSVEESFQARLAGFAAPGTDEPQRAGEVTKPLAARSSPAVEPQNKPRSKAIDKSVLALPEPRRIRDREHVRYVAKQPCLVCGRQPSDAHHLRFTQSRALSRKVSDEFTVPLCRGHHREVHRCGDEAAWWRKLAVDFDRCGARPMARNASTSDRFTSFIRQCGGLLDRCRNKSDEDPKRSAGSRSPSKPQEKFGHGKNHTWWCRGCGLLGAHAEKVPRRLADPDERWRVLREPSAHRAYFVQSWKR